MDRASQVLAQGVPPDVPSSYRALADHSKIPNSTLHHRARRRRSIEEKAQGQKYLKPWEGCFNSIPRQAVLMKATY